MKFIAYILFLICLSISEANALRKTTEYSCQTDEKQRQYCVDSKGRLLADKLYVYYENGQYSAIVNFKNGYYDGLTTLFDEKGRLLERAYYKQGVKNGMDKIYHPNRTIKIQANYQDGLLDGEQVVYYADGKIAGRFTYKKGRMQKGYCDTYKNGQKTRRYITVNEMREMADNQFQTCGEE